MISREKGRSNPAQLLFAWSAAAILEGRGLSGVQLTSPVELRYRSTSLVASRQEERGGEAARRRVPPAIPWHNLDLSRLSLAASGRTTPLRTGRDRLLRWAWARRDVGSDIEVVASSPEP